jgi:TorA maturation chaperone TorD
MNNPAMLETLPDDQTANAVMSDPRERACVILTRVARSRQIVYRWLALGFYPPDEDLAAALRDGRLVVEITAAIDWLGQDRQPLIDQLAQLRPSYDVALTELVAEYERLFGTGLDRIAPREAAYRWRDASDVLQNREAVAQLLRLQYQQFGVTPVNDRDDHVAVELEFLSFLCGHEAASWASGATEAARLLRRQEGAFLDDHLGRWLPEFCQRVRARTLSPVYAVLAGLSDAWLRLEHGPGYLPIVIEK